MPTIERDINSSIGRFLKKNNIPKSYLEFDENLEDFEERVEKWLSVIDYEDKEVFTFLLENFTYITRKNLISILKVYYDQFKSKTSDFEESLFLPVTSFGGVFNGAVNIVECFQMAVRKEQYISKKNIAVNAQDFHKEFNLDSVKNIVFIDDIIGSGTTFKDFLYRTARTTPSLLKDKKLYVLSLYNLEKGVKLINDDLNEKAWEIDLINSTIMPNIFKDKNIYQQDVEKKIKEHKKIIKKYEEKVNPSDMDRVFRFGYKRSAILLAFYYNTPNNTLSTFWKEINGEWHPFFPRVPDEDKYSLKVSNSLKEIREHRDIKQSRLEFIQEQMELEERRRDYGGN